MYEGTSDDHLKKKKYEDECEVLSVNCKHVKTCLVCKIREEDVQEFL